jgi:hypothetical protein
LISQASVSSVRKVVYNRVLSHAAYTDVVTAGLSSSLEDQVSHILDVVQQGLRRVSISRRKEAERRIERAQNQEKTLHMDTQRRENIRLGIWHDGRVDCIAGNGVMSELGVGIEGFSYNDEEALEQERGEEVDVLAKSELKEKARKEREYASAQDLGALPVVVIKGYDANVKSGKEVIATALANWSAELVNRHVSKLWLLCSRLTEWHRSRT